MNYRPRGRSSNIAIHSSDVSPLEARSIAHYKAKTGTRMTSAGTSTAATTSEDNSTSTSAAMMHQHRYNYATFRDPRILLHEESPLSSSSPNLPTTSKPPLLNQSISTILSSAKQSSMSSPPSGSMKDSLDRHYQLTTITWRVVIVCSILVGIFACLRGKTTDSDIAPEWHWDHNVYVNHNSNNEAQTADGDTSSSTTAGAAATTTTVAKISDVVLMVQLVTNEVFNDMVAISSRPNRAYAKEHGMDFVQINSGRQTYYSARACFDKVWVLNDIVDRQRSSNNNNNDSSTSLSLWPSHSGRGVKYGSIILLQPDSIITEMDQNLIIKMLPEDKLVAIAGWENDYVDEQLQVGKISSQSDIILFNLQHKYAETVAKLWWEIVEPSDVTCGANNELDLLVSAISAVKESNETLADLIQPLAETPSGFVDDGLIRCIPQTVPGSKTLMLLNSVQESAVTLQETADAVCYRFYPKCEVL